MPQGMQLVHRGIKIPVQVCRDFKSMKLNRTLDCIYTMKNNNYEAKLIQTFLSFFRTGLKLTVSVCFISTSGILMRQI